MTMGFIPDSDTKNHASIKAATIAGKPNFINVLIRMFAQQHELKEIIQEVNYSSKSDSNINREKYCEHGQQNCPQPET